MDHVTSQLELEQKKESLVVPIEWSRGSIWNILSLSSMNHVISLLESARGILFPWDLRKKDIISIVLILFSMFIPMGIKNHLYWFHVVHCWKCKRSLREPLWSFIRIRNVAFQYWFHLFINEKARGRWVNCLIILFELAVLYIPMGIKKNIVYSNTGFTWFIDESARLMRELCILILVLSGSSIKL